MFLTYFQECMEKCCYRTDFRCQSFAYSEKKKICNLISREFTEQKSSKDLEKTPLYNFYLRIEFFNRDQDENFYDDGVCYQKRFEQKKTNIFKWLFPWKANIFERFVITFFW